MKKYLIVVSLALGLTFQTMTQARAEDLTDKVQFGGNAAAAWPLGQKEVTNGSKNVGTDFGGLVAYGIDSHLSLGLSYDNINLGKGTRLQPILFNGIYRLFSDKVWTPNVQLGAGMVEGTDGSYNHVSAKAGLGLEYFVCSHLSVGPQVTYVMADDQTKSKQYAHVVTAGIFANFFFGGPEAAAPVAAAPPPPAEPVVAAIAVSITPAQTTLGPGATVQLAPSVSGTPNTGVTWAIDPMLGSVDQTGLYTAPATVQLPETVNVTATSMADGTKVASAQVHLRPLRSAPKDVAIRMDILFDSNKTVIKPQFDSEIKKVADFMKTYPHSVADIDGYTDSTGPADYNLTLSQKRAESVRDEMVSKFGIASSRLTPHGFGETKPIDTNTTAAGRAQNRRVIADLTATEN